MAESTVRWLWEKNTAEWLANSEDKLKQTDGNDNLEWLE